jgi:2-dehydro-3-deoxygluconokinase
MYRSNSVASTINQKDLDKEYIKQSKILHVSGISQGISQSCKTAVLEAVKLAKSHDLLVSYDPNFREYLWENASDAKDAMDEILEYTDIIFPSHPGDTEKLLGITEPDDIYNYFKSWNVPTVILKCGEKGAIAYVENKKYTMPSIAPYGIIDVTGAGDTFVGTYLHCINHNIETKEALKWSTTAAGIKVGGRSITSQPKSTEIQKHLSKVIINHTKIV